MTDVINRYVHFKMFRYNPKANYQPNGVRYLQVLSGKDLYKQTIVISAMGKMILFQRDLQIFLLIIRQDKCMLGTNCGQTGMSILCDYGKLS